MFAHGWDTVGNPTAERLMAYYIYRNWHAGPPKAKIHREFCRHCNYGRGHNDGRYDRSKGKWYGPYDSPDEAKRAQSKMDVKDRSECGTCMKS